MAERQPQTFANHARLDPLFHLFVLPVFLAALIWAVVRFFVHLGHRSPGGNLRAFLIIVLAAAAATLVVKARLYSLRVQDRVIRLEERIRLMQLLPEPLRWRIPELTEDQLCGLRFASDAEVAKLSERALNEKLGRKQIKQAIQNWRPDYWRV
jgi:Family of unknown function (DUF6526)